MTYLIQPQRIMKPSLLYVIDDSKGDTILKFPQGSLLERIIDEWPLIVNYHEHYYPFSVDAIDNKYRKITLMEAKTDRFKKLFISAYKKNRINGIKELLSRTTPVVIDGFPLCLKNITNQVYIYKSLDEMIFYSDQTQFNILHYIENIDVDDSFRIHYLCAQLLVLSDVVFDEYYYSSKKMNKLTFIPEY